MRSRTLSGRLTAVVPFLALVAAAGTAMAQADGGGHLGHHPGAGAPGGGAASASSPATPVPAAPAGGMGEMMGGMMGASPAVPAPPGGGMGMGGIGGGSPSPAAGMGTGTQAGGGCGGGGCMGGGTSKPFYAALMGMPTLTPEARRFIEAEAGMRLGLGSEAITAGQASLHHALSSNNAASMQQAVERVREGVLLAQSGAAALRAVKEGQPPRQIALAWFNGQMGTPANVGMAMGNGAWGLSWYHLTTMAFLIAFMAGAIAIHYARARRIGVLVERLTPGGAPIATPAKPSASEPVPAIPVAPDAAGGKPATAVVPAAAPEAAPRTPVTKGWSGMLRVGAIFDETPTVKTFRLKRPDCGSIPFTFLPGQFLTFSADIDGKPIRRSYTIASSPTQRDYIEITVKREDQGAESRYLHDHVATGDLLSVSGPSGAFTFTGSETDSIVLISGGVGITPMMCIVRYLTDCSYPGDIFFLHGARTPRDYIFRDELDYLRRRHRNVHVSATMSDPAGTAWTGSRGQISKAFITGAVTDIARRRVHVCGPPAMMEAVMAELIELGVPKGKIKSEAFGAAKGAAPAPSPKASTAPAAADALAAADPPQVNGEARPTTEASVGAGAPSAQAEVRFRKSGKSGTLAPDQPVLEAAEAIGVAIDYSCRVGTCGMCVVPLLEGSVTMDVEDGLLPADKARGIILACQAKSVGNLVVDA